VYKSLFLCFYDLLVQYLLMKCPPFCRPHPSPVRDFRSNSNSDFRTRFVPGPEFDQLGIPVKLRRGIKSDEGKGHRRITMYEL